MSFIRKTIYLVLVIILSSVFILFCGCNISEIQEHEKKLEEWNSYKAETNIVINEFKEEIKVLEDIYVRSVLSYNPEVETKVLNEILESYEEYITSLARINSPEFASDLHGLQIEVLSLEKEKWEGISEDYKLYIEPDEQLEQQISDLLEKIENEFKNIRESLEELTEE
jgi:hypothetical protein